MAKYITSFQTLADYEAAKENLNYPNVTLIDEDGSLRYEKEEPPHDYSKDFFTMNIATGGDIVWSGSTTANTLSYSKDNGQTWATADSATTISVNDGDKVLWKGTPTPRINKGIGRFSGDTTVRYEAQGNTMSLLYGENFSGQTSLSGKDYALYGLFIANTNVTSAENLVLPATTLTDYCYQYMFQGCSSLTTAPSVLPATTSAGSCYNSMFNGCTSLTTAPELPATTLANGCYSNMFYGCSSLTTAPELPATTLKYGCYQNMFRNCSSLNYIKCLATDISANNCTSNWVNGVASSGTFVKDASMTGWTSGVNGIPNGWTVVDAV